MTSLPLGTREQMMEAIEIAASTVDEAVAKAADQLGVGTADVAYTVLEESKGLFGKGQVRIRAEAKASEDKPAKKPRATKKAAEPPASAVVEQPEPEPQAAAPRGRKKVEKVPKQESRTEEAGVEAPDADVVATEADAAKIIDMVNGLLKQSGLNVKADVSELTGKYVNLRLSGGDAGFLVGRRGEVLNALQYLLNVISARQLDNGVRVVVDGEDYRRRRQDVLEKLALDIASEVRKRGEEAVLDALPAFERRVIHQALTDYEGVTTYSEGEEPERRVVIAPAEAATAS